jgi:hypothetical protein
LQSKHSEAALDRYFEDERRNVERNRTTGGSHQKIGGAEVRLELVFL